MNKEEIKCVICQKGILDNSHFINGKYYHNSCIEQLQNNWSELKEENEKLKRLLENPNDMTHIFDNTTTIKPFLKELESRK